ncbi:MAG: dihydrofolate reductase family protein [Cyanobacteria bacterium P01_F01_bin.53]
MNPKVSVFIATSLDGFIARKDGTLDWLDAANANVPDGEDCGYQAFIETVDVLVMGRNTYEKVMTFGSWPYGNLPVVVLSRNPTTLSPPPADTVTYSDEMPKALCDRLSREGINHIYLDGGTTIQRFLSAGLVDELLITVIPILLGDGKPLFGQLPRDTALTCLNTKRFEFGFVQMHYRVEKDS